MEVIKILIFNGVDILQKYDCISLLSVEVVNCTVNNEYIWLNGCDPIEKLTYDNGGIKVKVLVEEDRIFIGRLLQEMSSGTLIHEETYHNIVTLINYTTTRIIENVYEVEFEYSTSFKMYDEIENTITKETTINYEGTVDTPLYIRVIASDTTCGFNINGTNVGFKGISVNDYIVIDKNKIMINGVNGFGKCTIYSFPKMVSGENYITVNNCSLEIKYNPMFL